MTSSPKQPMVISRTPTQSLLSAARFGIPELPSPHVRRSRLLSALAASEHTALTLVSAPAGTGKTTLVADWARQHLLRAPTGWVTFDDEDVSLWPDLVLCLRRLGVPVPQGHPGGTGTTRPSRSQLTSLAEGIASAPERLTIVLDGYDLVRPEEARELHYLLEHSAGRLGLVLVTRVDPVLPLYRYRLDDSLVELRVTDLAFDDGEASTLLRGAGVVLDAEVLHAVNTRVRGWAAGLRFAARALVGQVDVDGSAASAVTQALDINEYLVGEVLDVQTPEVRDFLLQTAVADVLSPALVSELCGPQARHLLAGLGHLNTFVEPVPGQPGCYRYYPFFKELLQAQLAYERPRSWAELHRTAATWCQQQGLPDRALSHLAATRSWREVAALLVGADRVAVLLSEGDLAGPVWSAATRLPRELDAPEACAVRAAVALVLGDAHACASELARARAGLYTAVADASRPGASPVVAATLATIDVARATLNGSAEEASVLGEVAAEALEHARLTSPGASSPGLLALVARCRGITAMRCGDPRRARAVLHEAVSSSAEDAGMPPGIRADILGHLAIVDAFEGHLARAARTAEDSLALSDGKRSAAVCHGEAAAHIALGAIALERCHAKQARHHVTVALTSPALCGHPLCRALTESVLAGVERATGSAQAALTRLEVAANAMGTTDPWLADRLRVESARLGLAGGRAEQALASLDTVEHQGMTQAAAVAAVAFAETGRFTAVEGRLSHLRQNAPNPQTEVMALLAEGALDLHRHAPVRAHAALDRSLRLAAPEGLRRPFREGGPRVQELLASHPVALREHAWLTPGTGGDGHAGMAPAPSRHAPSRVSEPPVEELTPKELEVLAHLAELLTTEEIATRMFISVNTVRTHVRNILRKLAVNRRNAAIRRARELGLLGDPDPTAANAS
jgi:LuxR family transcriptional regulator, maltose regulon positive regulatory protein